MLKTLLHCVQLHLNQLNLLHLYINSNFLHFTMVKFGYAHVHFLLAINHFPCFSKIVDWLSKNVRTLPQSRVVWCWFSFCYCSCTRTNHWINLNLIWKPMANKIGQSGAFIQPKLQVNYNYTVHGIAKTSFFHPKNIIKISRMNGRLNRFSMRVSFFLECLHGFLCETAVVIPWLFKVYKNSFWISFHKEFKSEEENMFPVDWDLLLLGVHQ